MITFIGIILISAATLLLELALLRIFAVQQFYHFAFMAISLALLGAGASGSLLSVWRRRLTPAVLSLAFALSTVLAYLVINVSPFDSFSIAWDSRQILFLAIYFLAAAVPFLFAGLLVGGELISAGEKCGAGSHRVYGSNLIGSACGSLGSLLALAWFGGPGTVVLAATLSAAAGLFFAVRQRWISPDRRTLWVSLALFAAVVLGVMALLSTPDFLKQRLSPYKTLSILPQALESRHTLSVSDATARVDVVESSTIHIMPGLSLFSPAGLPTQAGLMLDGDSLMPISRLEADSDEARFLADYLPLALAFQLRPDGRSLVLEAGTGLDVLLALASGAQQVTAVEENERIIEIMREEYGEWTGGLYREPRVAVINQSGRVFARQKEGQSFDLVILSLTDPHRPVTSGAYSLTEEYANTVEAFEEYLRVLDEDGFLVVTRWLQTPPSESARTFATMAAALENSERDPGQHLVAFRTLRTMTIVAGARPFESSELRMVRSFLDERGFDAVHLPDIQERELNRFNVLPDPAYYTLFAKLLDKPEETFAAYRYDIQPPTDDHPFFFHYFKWRQTPEILAGLGQTWQPFGGSGFFVLVALLLLVSAAAILFIVGPLLLRLGSADKVETGIPFWRWRVLLYFAALGLAFLFVEVPLAQRFILVLGKPVTALAVILFALLLFSGIGSLTSRGWSLSVALVVLVLMVAVYPFILAWLSSLALRWPEWARFALTVVVLAPLGYMMGIPFARGLSVVEQHDSALVPWAWAINGSFSVISSVLAVIFALTWGFAVVLWLGAAAYGMALLVFGRLAPR
jgi:SAM-dependent methyltransferase